MQHRRRLAVAATVVALIGAVVAAPAARAEDTSGASIAYSDLYLKLIAAFPAGWVLDSCQAVLGVTGRSGICSATLVLEYFYPDGSFGKMPWYADPASATGWSVEPDSCASLTDAEYLLWVDYDNFVNGYADSGPQLTDEQISLYGICWFMGF